MRYVIEMCSDEIRDRGANGEFHRSDALACWEVIDTQHPQRRPKASRIFRQDANDIAEALNFLHVSKTASQEKVAA